LKDRIVLCRMKIVKILFSSLLIVGLSQCTNIVSPKKKTISARITAYHAKESDHLKYKNKNAVGSILEKGQVATDWSVIPVNSKIKFDGHVYVVTDYGSALCTTKHNMPVVDLFVDNKREMKQWGVKYMDIEVIEWGDWQKSKDILSSRLKYKHCRHMYENIKL
jgi:3D (Asp-Asp-Asp) domain-containing protein